MTNLTSSATVLLKNSNYKRLMNIVTSNNISGHVRQNGRTIPVRYSADYDVWYQKDMSPVEVANKATWFEYL